MIPSDRPTPAPQPPHSSKTKALPPGKAPANCSQNDRPASAPLPLSEREQQVCNYLSKGITFEAIARDLGCSPAAAKAYHRRAISKRQRTIALAPLEQGDRNAPRVRNALAQPEPAVAKVPCDRPASNRSLRSPFHSPAVEASALRECPSPLDLCVPSLFVEGYCVTTRRSHFSQMTITDSPTTLSLPPQKH